MRVSESLQHSEKRAKFVMVCEKLLQISLPVWRAYGFASLPSQMVVELQDLRPYSILQLTKALNPLRAGFAWRHKAVQLLRHEL